MPSPNYDNLHLRLARMIDDRVTVATANGNAITSALRDVFLNNGIRKWVDKKITIEDREALRSYIKERVIPVDALFQIQTALLSPKIYHLMTVWNETLKLQVFPTPVGVARRVFETTYTAGIIHNLYYQWLKENQAIRFVGSSPGNNIEFIIVEQHTDLTANNATDILIETQYFDEVLDEAFLLYCQEYPTAENIARLQVKAQIMNGAKQQ